MFKELIAKLFIVKLGCGKFPAAAALHKFIIHKVAGTNWPLDGMDWEVRLLLVTRAVVIKTQENL